ncbi:hypothetical protein VB738_11030 [Cyanobium gracile UHCC 0139]|uniref:Uncharacterized protein n=1 Tax=Cyanobium gracile UHCC 0139 TaxID=3110308 RepID=A0ABU5RVJ0_9CYAN|nr:hypothetical protein [Cyanobium gracile]MEA5391789.1 hypothetical protein [Cyanobium gracile UHCC 0139]
MLRHQSSATDLLFITLRKSEALFSPCTRYRDLALGPSLLPWESHEGKRPMAIRWRLEREIPVMGMRGCSSPSLVWRFEGNHGSVSLTPWRRLPRCCHYWPIGWSP